MIAIYNVALGMLWDVRCNVHMVLAAALLQLQVDQSVVLCIGTSQLSANLLDEPCTAGKLQGLMVGTHSRQQGNKLALFRRPQALGRESRLHTQDHSNLDRAVK